MQFLEENNIPGLLLLIDFEKAFDSLSWSFMQKVLISFNFGPSIVQWISTFYNDTQVVVNQGGNLSSFFNTERGCKQGDPISPYIFILCAEILAIKIRKNEKIKWIKINNNAFILTQYADNTKVILDGSEESLNETLHELEQYAKNSGPKVNFFKTHIVLIGLKKYSTDSIKTKWKLNWSVNRLKLLGITFDTDLDKMLTLNFSDKNLKLEDIRMKLANPILPFPVQVHLKSKKGTQDMYNLLNKNNDPLSGKISWNKKYKFEDNEWKTNI